MSRVLVLDGFDESRESTIAVLQSAGFSVVGVAEEDEALAILAKGEVDVVLLDLPIAESIEAAEAIREQCGPTSPRVVALIEITDERERARAAGIDFLILRPCPPPQLAKHLRRFDPLGR